MNPSFCASLWWCTGHLSKHLKVGHHRPAREWRFAGVPMVARHCMLVGHAIANFTVAQLAVDKASKTKIIVDLKKINIKKNKQKKSICHVCPRAYFKLELTCMDMHAKRAMNN